MHATALPDLRRSPLSLVKTLLTSDIFIRVGFRPGARTLRGMAFDALWRGLQFLNPKAATVYYWIGTDVVNAVQDYQSGKLNLAFFERSKRDSHFAGAPWFIDELAGIGIKASDVLFPTADFNVDPLPPLPRQFTVMSYVPDARHQYYGGEALAAAAKALPEVDFHILGGEGKWASPDQKNFHFHGWQTDMKRFYEASTVVVRLVPHDALGGTIREGLAFGRHIVYSYPVEFTNFVAFGDTEGLISTLRRLKGLNDSGNLGLNIDGRDFSARRFDERRTTQILIESLNEVRHPDET